MKKLASIISVLLIVSSLTACNNNPVSNEFFDSLNSYNEASFDDSALPLIHSSIPLIGTLESAIKSDKNFSKDNDNRYVADIDVFNFNRVELTVRLVKVNSVQYVIEKRGRGYFDELGIVSSLTTALGEPSLMVAGNTILTRSLDLNLYMIEENRNGASDKSYILAVWFLEVEDETYMISVYKDCKSLVNKSYLVISLKPDEDIGENTVKNLL